MVHPLRTAAYARVSTKSEEQLNSLTNQKKYYKEYITGKPNLIFAKVYVDQLSGRSLKNRKGMQSLLRACRAGKIDYIITKSIKRFSRNTVELLQLLRELKALGISVYFEVERLHIKDPKAELMITILASLAQNESEGMSYNIKWGMRQSFRTGSSTMANRPCYGYMQDESGRLIPNPQEVPVIRTIFNMRSSGKTLTYIANCLNNKSIPSPRGNNWHPERIRAILANEKYVGSVLLQKTYSEGFLNNRRRKNIGQRDSVMIENHHEGIVGVEVWRRAGKLKG